MLAKQNIPNLLTIGRAAAVPVALILILLGTSALTLFWIFLLASVSDFLDGYLARKWNATSSFGIMLDPMADKLLVALILLYLLSNTTVPMLPVAVIMLRELYVAGLRDFLSSRGATLPVSTGGKWKTAIQMLALTVLLFSLGYNIIETWYPGILLLWIAAALALTSAIQYTRTTLPHIH